MSSLDFVWNGYHCFSSGDSPEEFYFLPLAADVQRDSDGQLAISIHEVAATTYAMFAACWGPSAADLKVLRDKIAASLHNTEASQLRLGFAPVLRPSCNMLVSDGAGHYEIAATSDTSGFPPYTVVFNLAWQEGLALQLKEGLSGKSGHLGIEYRASLARPASASARLETTAEAIHAYRSNFIEPKVSMVNYVEHAIRTGEAVFTLESYTELDDAQKQALLQRCAEKCGALLALLPSRGTSGTLVVKTEINEMVEEPVRAFCDIGTLIIRNSPVMRAGGTHAPN